MSLGLLLNRETDEETLRLIKVGLERGYYKLQIIQSASGTLHEWGNCNCHNKPTLIIYGTYSTINYGTMQDYIFHYPGKNIIGNVEVDNKKYTVFKCEEEIYLVYQYHGVGRLTIVYKLKSVEDEIDTDVEVLEEIRDIIKQRWVDNQVTKEVREKIEKEIEEMIRKLNRIAGGIWTVSF